MTANEKHSMKHANERLMQYCGEVGSRLAWALRPSCTPATVTLCTKAVLIDVGTPRPMSWNEMVLENCWKTNVSSTAILSVVPT